MTFTICSLYNDIIVDKNDRSIKIISKNTNDSFNDFIERLKSRSCYDMLNEDIFYHLTVAIEKHLEL